MPLTLVLGPANSSKAGEVLGAYIDAAHRGALLVVPTALDAEYYSRELAAQRAVLSSVLTFAGLAAEIARRTNCEGRLLSVLQRQEVLRRAVANAELEVLGRSATSPGFAAAAGNLIGELDRSLVTPARFARGLAAWAGDDQRRVPYARDLAALFDSYTRELDRLGAVDADLYTRRALDALRADPGSWGSGPVFLYGFDDLHPLERDTVETLSRVVGAEVTASLTYEPGRAALMARAETVEELRPLAERVVELPALDDHYLEGSRAALHHVERWLFESPPARIEPGDAVRLLEAGGELAEAELIAAEVLALLRAGVPGEQIVVVYRSLASAAPVIERVFGRYGIPLSSDHRVPFARTGLGRRVLALARCALLERTRARAEDLLAYIRSPGLLQRPEVADALEAQVRREGGRTASEARAMLGWHLEEIDHLRRSSDQLSELGRQARRLFAAPHTGSAPQLAADQELDARALSALLGASSELGELPGSVSGLELIELLERIELQAGAAPRAGTVLLADPLSIRARRFRAVFVCGLQEGEFPHPGAPEPFLSDDRRRELAACAGIRLSSTEDSLARERYLFYACVSRATEQLFLSYRSSDEDGNLALPSPFVADVADLLVEDWTDRRRRRLLADVVWDPDSAPSERELARALASAAAPAAGAVELPSYSLGKAALEQARHREIVSAGALEAYADCPIKWLVDRELQPARFEPEVDAIARGSFMHATLEEVLRRLAGPVTPESLPDARRILGDVLRDSATGRVQPIAPGRSPGVRAAALRMIEADLRRYLEHEAADGCDWRPEGLELRFGFDDEEPSLSPLGLGAGVSLRGVVDRVDVDPGGTRRAIVRDYKSGRARPEHQATRWRSDRQLQVALYMLAVSELLGLEPVAGLYQPLGGADLRARGVFVAGAPIGTGVMETAAASGEQLRAELEDARARAVALVARLREGELTPCPETCSRDGCMYPGICRSQ